MFDSVIQSEAFPLFRLTHLRSVHRAATYVNCTGCFLNGVLLTLAWAHTVCSLWEKASESWHCLHTCKRVTSLNNHLTGCYMVKGKIHFRILTGRERFQSFPQLSCPSFNALLRALIFATYVAAMWHRNVRSNLDPNSVPSYSCVVISHSFTRSSFLSVNWGGNHLF